MRLPDPPGTSRPLMASNLHMQAVLMLSMHVLCQQPFQGQGGVWDGGGGREGGGSWHPDHLACTILAYTFARAAKQVLM